MPKIKMTINANTLFPISELKSRLKEVLKIADQIGPAIITKGNRPAYAVIRLDIESELSEVYAEQIALARANAKGKITSEPNGWEKP